MKKFIILLLFIPIITFSQVDSNYYEAPIEAVIVVNCVLINAVGIGRTLITSNPYYLIGSHIVFTVVTAIAIKRRNGTIKI